MTMIATTHPADLQEIQWSPHQHQSKSDDASGPSRNALLSLQLAQIAATDFDQNFQLRNVDRELSAPLFDGNEVVLRSSTPSQMHGYYSEYELQGIRLVVDLLKGDFGTTPGEGEEDSRHRCADRIFSNSQHYSARYLQKGIINSDHGPYAACEMIVETKILMSMAPHPNIVQVYGVNQKGIDAFVESGRMSFFLITDRLSETLVERLEAWRENRGYRSDKRLDDLEQNQSYLMERLEIANDICSALVFLHDRQLVMNIRPDKVGFDTKCGRVKLTNFGQTRQAGMTSEHNVTISSITKSDDVVGTLAYTAPEVLCNAPATTSSDVYAFGIMLWEIMSLRRPFQELYRAQHYERVVQNHERPPMNDRDYQKKWPKELCKLLQSCWDPHYRPTMKTVGETLETALLFHEPEAHDPLTSSTAATCDSADMMMPPVSPKKSSRNRSRGVRRAKSDNSSQLLEQRQRSHSNDSKGSAKKRSARRGSRSSSTAEAPQRRKVVRTKSLDAVLVTPGMNIPDNLRAALTKLTMSPADAAQCWQEIDIKSFETPTTVLTNGSGSEPRTPVSHPRRRSSGKSRTSGSPRSHASPSLNAVSSSQETPKRQTPRRSQSSRTFFTSPGGDNHPMTPASPRQKSIDGEAAQVSPGSCFSAATHLQKTQFKQRAGVRRCKSDQSPMTEFSLDNVVATRTNRTMSPRKTPQRSASDDGRSGISRQLSQAPTLSSTISVVTPSKGRGNGKGLLKKSASARDMGSSRAMVHLHHEAFEDRHCHHKLSAKLQAECASSSAVPALPSKLIRVKTVKKNRHLSNASNGD